MSLRTRKKAACKECFVFFPSCILCFVVIVANAQLEEVILLQSPVLGGLRIRKKSSKEEFVRNLL